MSQRPYNDMKLCQCNHCDQCLAKKSHLVQPQRIHTWGNDAGFLLMKSFIRIFQIIKIVVTALFMYIVLLIITSNTIITKKQTSSQLLSEIYPCHNCYIEIFSLLFGLLQLYNQIGVNFGTGIVLLLGCLVECCSLLYVIR